MVNSKLRVIATLLTLSILVGSHRDRQAQAALLNVTEEAILASQRLLREVENGTVYASAAQLSAKLLALSRIPLEFNERVASVQENGTRPDLDARDLPFYYAYQGYSRHALEEAHSRHEQLQWALRWHDGLTWISSADETEVSCDYCKDLTTVHLLRKLHSGLFEAESRVFALLLSEEQCLTQSRQHRMHEFLKLLSLRDAEGFVALQYALAQISVALDGFDYLDRFNQGELNDTMRTWKKGEKDPLQKLKLSEASFASRNAETLSRFRAELGGMSRNYSTCHYNDELAFTPTHRLDEEDVTFTKLGAFQRYIVNENDLSQDGSCSRECRDYAETDVHACFDMNGVCTERTACKGRVVDCGEDVESVISVCPTGNNDTRYSYLEIDGKKYGDESCPNKVKAKAWLRKFNKCSYCVCVCDNSDADSDVHFNLRPVLSNVTFNKVITGVRFKKVNRVIHIQIKEGKLLPHGTVNSSLAEWKPVDNYTVKDPSAKAGVDYHRLSWNGGRTVYLDRLDSPKDHAMIGIRFNLVRGNLRLEIQVAPFNFKTGELSEPVTEWIHNSAALRNRNELKLDDLKFLTSQEAKFDESADEHYYDRAVEDKKMQKHSAIFGSSKFVKFTTSRMEVDVGQSTIPYVDIEEVETYPAIPLSGAGIFVRNNEKIGPILALELLTFDFSSHF